MRVEKGKERLYIIIENEEDRKALDEALPAASEIFCFFTMDAGPEGNESALVITHRS